MKHILVTAILLFSWSLQSQEGVVFTRSFFPNSKYISQTLSKASGTINFIADEAILNELRSGGMELPMVMEQETDVIVINETSARDSLGSIPFMFYYDKMETTSKMNGKVMPQGGNPFLGAKVFGTYKPEGKMELDSIVGKDLNEQIKSTLVSVLDQIQQQIDFPENPIQIGESFTNEIPMSIPMGNLQPLKIIIKTDYHLTDIQDKIAFFDIEQVVTLNSEQQEMNLEASGEGTGILLFNMEKNTMVRNETDLPIKMLLTMPNDMKMEMEMETSTTITIKIE